MLVVDLVGFDNGLNVGCKIKRIVENDINFFSLGNYKNGVFIFRD